MKDTIEENMVQMIQNNEEIDEEKLYYDSAGSDKNGVYGLGSLACEYYKKGKSSSATEGLEAQQTIRELKRRLDQQDQLIEDMREQNEIQRRKVFEDMQQHFAQELQRQIDERIRAMIGAS